MDDPPGTLSVCAGDEPLRGWRWIRVVRVGDRLLAASIIDHVRTDRSEAESGPVRFGPESDARCLRMAHRAPAPECRCGFWSVPDRSLLEVAVGPRRRGWALAEVELTGTVIEAERGQRAEHQRILAVTVADRCERPGCTECSTGLTVDPDGVTTAACPTHDGALGLADAAGLLRTEMRFGELAPAAPTSVLRRGPGPIGGAGLTFLAAVAGAASVGAVATRTGSAAAAGAVVGLALVIGGLTGLGAALRSLARRSGVRNGPAFDTLATLAALTCIAVSVTAVIAGTGPPGP